MCICAHVCVVCSLALGNENEGVQLVCTSTCYLEWGVILGRRNVGGAICAFSIVDAGGSVCGCMCVYTHTHMHTAQMGYSVVSPGVRMRQTGEPKNPDGLNLGMRTRVQSTYLYVYARRRDEILD